MSDTYTAKLALTKPEIGASSDTWGNKLNDNLDVVDGLFDTGPYLKVSSGGTGAGTAAGARTALGLGTMATQSASAVAITGGTATLSSVTIGGGTGTFSSVAISGGTAAFSSCTVGGYAPYTANNFSSVVVTESQIQDGAYLARVGSNEAVTGSWSFSTVPIKTGAGKFLHYGSSTQNSGAITLSTSDASGTPGEGDVWIKYA